MAKQATITDLFTPLTSIQSCIESRSDVLNNSINELNSSVLNCRDNIRVTNKLILKGSKNLESMSNSMKLLNEQNNILKIMNSLVTTLCTTLNGSFDVVSSVLNGISENIVEFVDISKKISKNTSNKGTIIDKKNNIDLPNVNGGEGIGSLAKLIVNTAETINGIPYKNTLLMKSKIKNVLSGLFDSIKEYENLLDEKNIKKYTKSFEGLSKISMSISDIVSNMAKTTLVAPIAIVGSKLSKIVLNNVINLTDVLKDSKKLNKAEEASKHLKNISESILNFNKSMALSALLAVPAFVGVTLSSLVVSYALKLFKPLGNAKNTKRMVLASKNLENIASSILKFNISMALSSMIIIPSMVGVIGNFLIIKSASFLFSTLGKGKISVNIKKGALNIELMSLSMVGFSLAMLTSTMLTKYLLFGKDGKIKDDNLIALAGTLPLFGLMVGATMIYNKLGSAKTFKKTISAGISISLMSLGFMMFSTSLLLSTMITRKIIKNGMEDGKFDKNDILSIACLAPTFLLMVGAHFLYSKIGSTKSTKQVLNGGLSIMMMSIGLVTFSTSLYLSNLIIGKLWKNENGKADVMSIVTTVGVLSLMLGSSFTFNIIGKNSKNILMGFASTLLMSAGIGVFGIGVSIYANSLKDTNWETIGKMAALIGIFGLEFGLIGVPVVAGFVALGAVTLLTVSGSLFVFGKSMAKFIEPIKNLEYDDIKKLVSIIGVLGLEFAAIGVPVVAPFVALGSGAILTASASIGKLSTAMKSWSNVDIDSKQIELLSKTITSIKESFKGKGNLSVKKNAKGLNEASECIYILSKAVSEWSNVNINETKLNLLPKTMNSIKNAFGKDKDNKIKINKKYIESITFASSNLKQISKDLNEVTIDNLNVNDIDNLISIVGKIGSVFSVIGNSKNDTNKSLLKRFIGFDFSALGKTDVETGINATKKMGDALVSISKGLLDYQNNLGSKFSDKKFTEEFSISLSNVLGGLHDIFSSIGSDESLKRESQRASTNIGKLFQDFTLGINGGRKMKNNVKEGIKAVKDLGNTIKSIANGLKEFKDIVPNGKSSFIVDVAAGISALLQGIQEPLIAFGTTDEKFSSNIKNASIASSQYSQALTSIHDISAQTINYEHHKVDVAAALKNVGQIGELVKGLAEGTKILADPNLIKHLGKAGTIDSDTFSITEEGDGVIGNIQKLVCSNLSIFMELGKKIQDIGIYEAFHDEVVTDVAKGLFGKEKTNNKVLRVSEGKQSYITMAVTAAAGIGNVIKNLAEGYKNMNDTFPDEKSMTNGVAKVTKAISVILTSFNTIGKAIYNVDGKDTYEIIPSSLGLNEYTTKFGNISSLENLYTTSTDNNPFDIITQNVNTIISNTIKSFNEIVSNKNNFTSFDKDMEVFMRSYANLTTIALMFNNHKANYKVNTFTKNGISTLTLNELSTDIINNSNYNTKEFTNISKNLVKISDDFTKLNLLGGDNFVKFVESLNKGIIKLSNNKNINDSTKFINSLNLSVKDKVFDNISNNTVKIINTINSLNSDLFEPYSNMIVALSNLTDKQSDFISVQEKLYEILELIFEKMNNTNITPQDNTQNVQNNKNDNQTKIITNTQQKQSEPIIAKLSTNKVSLDYGNFMAEFENLLNRFKRSMNF